MILNTVACGTIVHADLPPVQCILTVARYGRCNWAHGLIKGTGTVEVDVTKLGKGVVVLFIQYIRI